jgi:serine-type anaerobic sulfatase-maturating enzyme
MGRIAIGTTNRIKQHHKKMDPIKKKLATILIKPAGPDCNMACRYCFYSEKQELFPAGSSHRMNEKIQKEVIRQVMAQTQGSVSFAWQGGEPTLMGLPFFEKTMEFQQRFGRNHFVGNGLQTNGLLLDEDWARFLNRYHFLVGLSIDGPEHVHDYYRLTRNGKGTWSRVVDRAKLLLDKGVEVNAVTVVNDYSADRPEEIYDFHKSLGLYHMQFIPCVEADPLNPEKAAPFSASAGRYGKFLCRLFDLWLADFREEEPTTFIRFFDSIFYHYVGLKPPECTLLKECGDYLVIEHNGEVYACDFFVEPRWKLGNVMAGHLTDMLNSRKQEDFGRRKAILPDFCRSCRWLEACRGGCVKDRIRDKRDKDLNHFCRSYQMFFEHADLPLRKLAEDWLLQRDQASPKAEEFKRNKIGRNESCPCGSGKKYKKCCGRYR